MEELEISEVMTELIAQWLQQREAKANTKEK